jgi:hypothetical protein
MIVEPKASQSADGEIKQCMSMMREPKDKSMVEIDKFDD